MKEGAVTALGMEPPTGQLGLQVDGLSGALVDTGGTAVAGDRVHSWWVCAFICNCVETTYLRTDAADLARLVVDDGHSATHELVRFQHGGAEYQFQIRGVYVGIDQDGTEWIVTLGRQMGECRCHTGFAGTSFTTENDQLLHGPASRTMS